MGFFEKISNALSSPEINTEDKEIWQKVTSEDDIANIFESSKVKSQVVFKHSTRCAVSFFAMRSLNTPDIIDNEGCDLHLIDVIHQRSISEFFANKVSIRHESPQIFVIRNGEVIWNDSHNSVNKENLLAHLN